MTKEIWHKSRSEETKKKIGKALRGRKQSLEVIEKRIKTRQNNGFWKDFEKTRKKMSENNAMKGKHGLVGNRIAWDRILKEIPELEKQGFKCIPIGKVIPDIIAIKNGKIYAIEIEYQKPNYLKYNKDNYKGYFEDVIWILR